MAVGDNLRQTPPDEYRCTANAKKTGKRCTKWALKGLKVCRVHGGANKVSREAGLRRHAEKQRTKAIEAKAAKLLAHEGLTPVEDPLAELARVANAARELMHSLGARVNALNSVESFDDRNAPHIRVEAEMYERAIDRTARLLDMLVKHGYTERQVKVQEQQVMMMAGVLVRVLTSLGLPTDQLHQAKQLMAEEFRQLDARTIQGTVTEADSN